MSVSWVLIGWKLAQRDSRELRIEPVLFGQDGRRDIPLDPQVWIGPQHSELATGIVVVAALINELRLLRKHDESMRKSLGNVDQVHVFVVLSEEAEFLYKCSDYYD